MKTLIILHTSRQATAFWLKDTNCLELLNLDTFSSGEGLFQAIDLALKKFRNHLIVSKQILFFTDADITDNNEECRKKIQTIPNENINGFHLGNKNVELMPKFFKKFFSIKLDDTDDYLSYLLKANEIIINSLTEENQQKVIKKIRSDKKITTHKNYLKI
ncbi:hypothetical protein AVCANL281_08795 [Campylobacter canadensis]|nr:hypothetical protein [Campylobacter canadensis]